MTTIDRDLVFLYSENARVKIKDLAMLLRKSSQRLKYSLKVLEKNGIVYNPHFVFDYSYFGLVLFRVYFKGGYIGEGDKVKIIKQLKMHCYITSIYELTGEYDLVLEMCAPNPSRFNKELRKIAALVPTLKHYRVLLNVVTHLYPRLYLVKDSILISYVGQDIIIGGDRSVEDFERQEIKLVKALLDFPLLRLTSIAKKSDLNVKTVVHVLKNLQKRKIVRSCHYVLDLNRLGISKFRVFLTLHNRSAEREAQLINYLLGTKEVVEMHRTIGDWDMEIDIESLDRVAVRSVFMQLREEFKDLIEAFNVMEFYHTYQKSYLPEYLFAESTEK